MLSGLKYVITGTGRCGTLFMANLFTSMGFPCSHEAVFTPKGFGWASKVLEGSVPKKSSRISDGRRLATEWSDCVAESSYMAAPFLGLIDAEVVHVVRDPMRVVASLTGGEFMQFMNDKPTFFDNDPSHVAYEEFIYGHVPEMRRDIGQLDRACLFYVRWNEMIENSGRVSLFHRIEDEVGGIKKFLGFGGKYHYDNTTCNSFPKRRHWSVSELMDGKIRADLEAMSDRYGYDLY